MIKFIMDLAALDKKSSNKAELGKSRLYLHIVYSISSKRLVIHLYVQQK